MPGSAERGRSTCCAKGRSTRSWWQRRLTANMAPPDRGPLPPPDFANRELPIETITAGTRLVRIHRNDLRPLFFGSTGSNRFDDPAKRYGVCYLATTLEGAFAETCL